MTEITEAHRAEAKRRWYDTKLRLSPIDLLAQALAEPAWKPPVDPAMPDEEDPIDALVDLLAPVLTHGQGMAARTRENRFRNALEALIANKRDKPWPPPR